MSRKHGAGVWALIVTLGVGCTGPDPTPEELELELEADSSLGLELISIPAEVEDDDEAPEAEAEARAEVELLPAGGPHVRFTDQTRCTNPGDEGGSGEGDGEDEGCLRAIGGCAIELVDEGFPAISLDGTKVVTFEYMISSGADEDDGTYDIVWRSVEDDEELRRQGLADGSAIGASSGWGEELQRCRREARNIRRLVSRVNAELEEGWRSLPTLAVQAPVPGWGSYEIDPETLAEVQAPMPAAARPVDALHRNGWFILRVPGVQVLHKEARTDWLGLPEYMTMDSYVPNLREFHGDAASGVVVVTMDYESGSCMSDSNPVYHVVKLAPETFEVIEQRAANVRELFS